MKTGKQLPGSKGMVVVQKPFKRGYGFFFWAIFNKLNCNKLMKYGMYNHSSGLYNVFSTKHHQKLTLISNGSQLNVD